MLQVSHVKHKKYEGTLYVMGERIAWMMSNKSDTFSINHKYADIKNQKISPEGKAKIQLQLVLHDGNSTTFHFVDPQGPPEQASHTRIRRNKSLSQAFFTAAEGALSRKAPASFLLLLLLLFLLLCCCLRYFSFLPACKLSHMCVCARCLFILYTYVYV